MTGFYETQSGRVIMLMCLSISAFVICVMPLRFPVFWQARHANHRVSELMSASGIAVSQREPGMLWSHNDSGYQPLIYAFDTEGHRVAEVRLTGLPHVDYEDITSFTWAGKPYLLLADTGDNSELRKRVSLYILPEPELQLIDHRRQQRIHAPAWSIHFVYEDGPQDVEAVAVDIPNERILLMTKRRLVPVLYELPLRPDPIEPHLPFHGNTALLIAKRIASLPLHPWISLTAINKSKPFLFNTPTAMELSEDGLTMYVLTYLQLYAYTRLEDETWSAALKHSPQILYPDLNMEQAEGLTRHRWNDTLYVISEGYQREFIELQRAE